MSPAVYQHVLWGIRGLVGGVVGGPPCRSGSRCSSNQDGGPPPVRNRTDARWGLDGLAGNLKVMVREDTVPWLRFLLAYAVAQAAADVPFLKPVMSHSISEGMQEYPPSDKATMPFPEKKGRGGYEDGKGNGRDVFA